MLTQKKLPKPKNQSALLLWQMIQGKMISEQGSRLNSFRTRLSELRIKYSVPILYIDEPFTNRFNRSGKYRKHFITAKGRVKALKVYQKINT